MDCGWRGPVTCLNLEGSASDLESDLSRSHTSSQGSATVVLALVGEPVLSVKSSTGATHGCSAEVRKPVGPG